MTERNFILESSEFLYLMTDIVKTSRWNIAIYSDIYLHNRRLSKCCARIIFQSDWRAPLKVNMMDKVALSVQASQDEQNNSVKHPEIVSLFVYFKLYVYTLSAARHARATSGKSPRNSCRKWKSLKLKTSVLDGNCWESMNLWRYMVMLIWSK